MIALHNSSRYNPDRMSSNRRVSWSSGVAALIAFVCTAPACLIDDGDFVGPPRTLLTGVFSAEGDVEWDFEYDGCRLTRAEWRRALAATLEPREYPHPLDIGPGTTFEFAYNGDGPNPTDVTVTDSSDGELRVRSFDIVTSEGVVTELRGQTTQLGGAPFPVPPPSATFFYGDLGLDSIAYTNARTIALSFSDAGRLERADFRLRTSSDVEFYQFDRRLANPLAELPIRYLFEYPAYWSNHPLTLGSYDLRTYEYGVGPNGYPALVRDLTFNDSTAVSVFEYERVDVCP